MKTTTKFSLVLLSFASFNCMALETEFTLSPTQGTNIYVDESPKHASHRLRCKATVMPFNIKSTPSPLYTIEIKTNGSYDYREIKFDCRKSGSSWSCQNSQRQKYDPDLDVTVIWGTEVTFTNKGDATIKIRCGIN